MATLRRLEKIGSKTPDLLIQQLRWFVMATLVETGTPIKPAWDRLLQVAYLPRARPTGR